MGPTHALARAALESAAQAVWLMDTSDPLECVVTYAAVKYVLFSGEDPARLMAGARSWLAQPDA